MAINKKVNCSTNALRCGVALLSLTLPVSAYGQDDDPAAAPSQQAGTIIVSGFRGSLQSALNEKRNADSLVEVIKAEDIGKLPDQNLAEVLENVTGVQITRSAGVGTGVQIRGTNANRIEINGVSSVGSGTGRGGIDFEDVNAAIIESVEVIKAPEAKTIEGSVGGTVNLRTIRPLDLRDRVASVRLQTEYSELSDSFSPRVSGSFGDHWSTGIGDIGVVLAASYSEQEATSFRPRVDRDSLVPSAVTADGDPGPEFPFLGVGFVNQELENFEYETVNFAGTLEWKPSRDIKLYFDAIISDQERRQDSSRVTSSGLSSILAYNVPTQFETIDFGSLDGIDLGTIQAALVGTYQPNLSVDDDDPNYRISSDTGARLTNSKIYRLGAEFELGLFRARLEGSTSRSNSRSPDLSTAINFINPNPRTPLDGVSNDNAVPFRYDFRNDTLSFGIDFDSEYAPTVEQLLDPANYVLDAIGIGNDRMKNQEDAVRFDGTFDTSDLAPFLKSFDVGYRYNNRVSVFEQIRANFNTAFISESPYGTLFSDLLVPGPNYFDRFDGRELAFRNYLIIDPDRSFSDPEGTLALLRSALATTEGSISDAAFDPSAFFDIGERTHSIYGQFNFEAGPVRGNAGLRWVATELNLLGNNVAGNVVTPVTDENSYDEFLPRINFAADLTQDLVFRASYGEDINRPDFLDLSLSVNFPTGPNNAVRIGNSRLAPETVASYDASLSWYFAPSSVLSVGVFKKKRTNLFVTQVEDVEVDENGYRDITPPCEGGGIFNPLPDRNVLSPVAGQGLCVPIMRMINDTGSTTQTGVEVAFQFDLSQFEDTLGFLSGFGVLANYTYQEFSGGEATNSASTRGQDIFEAANPELTDQINVVQGLLDFSPHAYNITAYYEKFGLSARARYTWRDAFRTNDTAGGATLNSTYGFPVVTRARGQLNASVTYDLLDWLNIGVEGVNLTKSKITQSCVNDEAILCFQGLPDRRITFGLNAKL